ncbi:MAG: translation initiation factor IF-2 subunit gamma [Candidatus Diapherotrites archaeon]
MAGKSEATQSEINIGLTGHVDHGKTSIAQTLTGKWTDTHSEEIKKGISIRLGYADASFYKCDECKGAEAYTNSEKCPSCGKKAKLLRKVSFVDAPGHETLMATMLSGAALMNGAILVIAANEPCPQPRTAEHLMALNIVGVKNIVVVQNKIDLVDKAQALKNHAEIKGFLKEYGFENAVIIPVAANFGVNRDLLIAAIEKSIPSPKHSVEKGLKMYIVRSFDVNKPGIKPEELKGGVVGGSIVHGEIKKGQEIELSPGIDGKKIGTTITEISVSAGKLENAHQGGLIGVQTKLDPFLTKSDQMRGQIVGEPGKLPEPTKSLKMEISPLKRLIGVTPSEIKVNDVVVLALGTMTAVGTIVRKLAGKEFEVLLKNFVVAEKGQNVALSIRDGSRWRLAAYGVVR